MSWLLPSLCITQNASSIILISIVFAVPSLPAQCYVVSIETSWSWVPRGWMWSPRTTQEVLRILCILVLIILVLFFPPRWCSDLQLSLLNPEPWPSPWPTSCQVQHDTHTHACTHAFPHAVFVFTWNENLHAHAERLPIPALQQLVVLKVCNPHKHRKVCYCIQYFLFLLFSTNLMKRPKPIQSYSLS